MISKDRQYVLLSVKWSQGRLCFWGCQTSDDKPRSFGGYTEDIDKCEKYTYEEAISHSRDFHDYHGHKLYELLKIDSDGTWIVKIEDLDILGERVNCYIV